jgi:lysophospholipase L1-like esterase
MRRFLFQGDSITDANRVDEDDGGRGSSLFGYGYPLLFASDYLKNKAGEYEFINRGVSGDRIVDLYARIKDDIINLKPDVMSILIGVNDVWHELNNENGVAAPKYEKIYDMLIAEIKEELPDIRIVILEPFVLKGEGTSMYYDEFRSELKLRGEAARRVADKHGLVFVSLQDKFDKAAAEVSPEYWTTDGVHPTAAGHQLIKEALAEGVESL